MKRGLPIVFSLIGSTIVVRTRQLTVTGQNGSGQNGMDKMVHGQNGIGQNGMDKMVRTKWYNFIFCEHLKFVEFNIYI